MKWSLAPVVALLAALVAGPALADGPMTASEFEAYVTGKTLSFGTAGDEPYGAEYYGTNRQVVWTFLDGDCANGTWYPEGESICFVYDFDPVPQCWQFFDEPAGLRAIFMNDPTASVLYEARDGAEPLSCPGPDLGV
jgi:hypothetical protein